METEAERCARYERFKKIDAAFRLGDLDALRAAVDDPGIVPNGPMPLEIGPCLVYAVYHSPLRSSALCLRSAPIPIQRTMLGFRR
jgi:hypothetical protein